MSKEIVMNSEEAIERVLGVLRTRMQEAIKEHRPVRCHAKAGMRTTTEEDGSFAFTMLIERRQVEPPDIVTPPVKAQEGDPTVCGKCSRVYFNGTRCPWCGEPR